MLQLSVSVGCVNLLLVLVAPSQQATWDQQRDNLGEYELSLAIGVRDLSECLVFGSQKHQGAQFNELDRTCQLLTCKLGDRGCRKCRHAQNSSLPMIWVKHLDQVDNTCWRTIQHRVDDTVNFTRDWSDYAKGFGSDPNKNYWIGLRTLSALTYQTSSPPLRIEMKLWNGSFVTMEYSSLKVAPEAENFTLLSIGSYTSQPGSYGNCLIQSVGINFSTVDVDNDINVGGSCAQQYKGGWWYFACHCANPNGLYYNSPEALNTPSYADGIVWSSVAGYYYSMQEMELMIR